MSGTQPNPSQQSHERVHPHNIRDRVFYGLLTKAKLQRVRFQDLRHTFASLLLQNGESPVYVKEQMGHSSIQITVDCYGHLIPGGTNKPSTGSIPRCPSRLLGWNPQPRRNRDGIRHRKKSEMA